MNVGHTSWRGIATIIAGVQVRYSAFFALLSCSVISGRQNKNGSNFHDTNRNYVRYTPVEIEALERLYHDCPKLNSHRTQQLIRECLILSNIIELKQINCVVY
ncbi:putative transcription regulator Homeodomain-LIKE family [Helianthus anomalus]